MSRENLPYWGNSKLDFGHTYAGLAEANRAARSNEDRRSPSGYGIVLEVSDGRIVGARHVEQSPVLRPEAQIEIIVDGTSRHGLSLVEAYGAGPAPAGNLRWGADLFVVDRDTADFVVQAIIEKLEHDRGSPHGMANH